MDYEKKYKEALERAKQFSEKPYLEDSKGIVDYIFPELAESEDERIRKSLIDMLKNDEKCYLKEIAWLEKQGSQDNIEDVDILHRFSFYSYKDEPNVLYLSGLYVNEEYRNKGIGTKILEVADEVAKSLNCRAIRLKTKKGSNAERLYQIYGYNILATEERDEIWFEKQGEQKHTAEEVLIKAGLKPYKDGDQWCVLLGDNIQEGICGFGNTIEDALYAFLKDLIASQGEQKPADKVEPKFKVGDWIVYNDNIYHIGNIALQRYYECLRVDGTVHTFGLDIDSKSHLWTIQDAKDGDVLHSTGFHNDCIFIFNRLDNWKFDESNGDRAVATGYCCLSISADKIEFGIQGPDCVEVNTIKPATKIQRDLLFQKMKEAGYEWDAEKKELKQIEQKPYGQREECLDCQVNYAGECKGSCAMKRGEQKPAEWSEEDERNFDIIYGIIYNSCIAEDASRLNTWLLSLKNRYAFKPSKEQMKALNTCIMQGEISYVGQVPEHQSLYNDLKKLTE